MAGALWKKEVVIRPSSTISVQGGKDWTKNWLDSFQNDPSNLNPDGTYIDYFFGDMFDSRTSNLYRIFSSACQSKYSLTVLEFNLLIMSRFVLATEYNSFKDWVEDQFDNLMNVFWPRSETSDDSDLAEDRDFLITRGGLSDTISEFITESKVINDAGIINGSILTLSSTPVGGIIGAKCLVKDGSSDVYDEVDCSVIGNTVTISSDAPNEYHGKVGMVSYLINA